MNPLQAILLRKQALSEAMGENDTMPPAPPPREVPLSLEQRKEFNESDAGQYYSHAEIKRICGIPVRSKLTPEEVDAYSEMVAQSEAYHQEGFRLFPDQAQALYEYEMLGGLVAPITVGGGKTLVALGIAGIAYAKGLRKMILLYPPQLTEELTKTAMRWVRKNIGINYPYHVLHGKSSAARKALAKSGKPGLYLFPYSLLSVKDTDELLNGIAPQIIIADESHRLANKSSARTRRITKAVEKFSPEFVTLSGTYTSKSIKDYSHLSRWCLRENNPLPNAPTMVEEWAILLDAAAGDVNSLAREMQGSGRAGPILPLVKWAQAQFPNESIPASLPGFRKAFKLRLSSTPGVVASAEQSLGTSLIIHNRPFDAGEAEKTYGESWALLQKLIRDVADAYTTPNGDELSHALETWKWLDELSSGFYNELVWPTPQQYVQNRPQLTEEEGEAMLGLAKDHLESLKEYHKELRKFLADGRAKQGMDTPHLIGQEMYRNGAQNVPAYLYGLWKEAKDREFPGMPERISRGVRVCSYKVDDMVRWVLEYLPRNKGALVWYDHQEMGRWAYEELVRKGVDVLHCPAGDRGNRIMNDKGVADKVLVASYHAHGEGKNLQHFQEQYFLEFPRQARSAEQIIGRTHRTGQKADELTVNMSHFGVFEQMKFAACLNDALYIHQTTGTRQKLIYAGYDPVPKIFPPDVLRERGLSLLSNSAAQQRHLAERFSRD